MKHLLLTTVVLLLWLTGSFTHAESPFRPGDHIAIVGNTFADQLRIHGYLETLLLQHTQTDPISIRNLGWGGDMLTARDRPTGFPSEESTLKSHETDVIIACFGMGESFAGDGGIDEFKSQLAAWIQSHVGKQYNGKSEVRLVLVSPIACEDLGKLTPERKRRNRDLEAYTYAMKEVSASSAIPFVDLFESSLYLMDEAVGPKLTNNGIHLNQYGYWAISQTFFDQLTADSDSSQERPWMLRIDAKKKSSDARGLEISGLVSEPIGIRFQVIENTTPTIGPPTPGPLPPQLQYARDTLVVENLPPGRYQLTIDGIPQALATATNWAEGVAIDSSPSHQSLEAYRQLVNDKNLQFTYSWKALNQVHIVGERKSSPSGKELPKEVIEFNELAKTRDAELRQGFDRKTRQWKLLRHSE